MPHALVRMGPGQALALLSVVYAAIAFLVWPADYLALTRICWEVFAFYVPVMLMLVVALIWRRTAFLARPAPSAGPLLTPALPAAS